MPRRHVCHGVPILTPALKALIREEVDTVVASILRDAADRLVALDDTGTPPEQDHPAEEPADPAPTPPADPLKAEREHLAEQIRALLIHDLGFDVGNDEWVGTTQALKLRAHDHDRPSLAAVDGRRMAYLLKGAAERGECLPGLSVRIAEPASHPARHRGLGFVPARHRGLGYVPARYGITPVKEGA